MAGAVVDDLHLDPVAGQPLDPDAHPAARGVAGGVGQCFAKNLPQEYGHRTGRLQGGVHRPRDVQPSAGGQAVEGWPVEGRRRIVELVEAVTQLRHALSSGREHRDECRVRIRAREARSGRLQTGDGHGLGDAVVQGSRQLQPRRRDGSSVLDLSAPLKRCHLVLERGGSTRGARRNPAGQNRQGRQNQRREQALQVALVGGKGQHLGGWHRPRQPEGHGHAAAVGAGGIRRHDEQGQRGHVQRQWRQRRGDGGRQAPRRRQDHERSGAPPQHRRCRHHGGHHTDPGR
nr:hypothetical protein [Tessaracoccus sp. MC1627]